MIPVRFVIPLVFTFAPFAAFAESDSCKKISALAADAMEARQSGDLLQDALTKVGDGSKFAQSVILKAYEKPIEDGSDKKSGAIREFQNEAYRVCFNANR